MTSFIAYTYPKTYLIVLALVFLVGLVWLVLDHYIFLPRRVKQIVEDIRKKQIV